MKPFKTAVEFAAFSSIFMIASGALMLLKVFYWGLFLSAPLAVAPALLPVKRARLMCRSAS